MQPAITAVIEQTLKAFCLDFLVNPYRCYTEHGLHALYYTQLFNVLAPEARYLTWEGCQVCVVQKEYPTADVLSKSRRQHWDVSVLMDPPKCLAAKQPSYDYLRLAAVVEFGLNAEQDHLQDDIQRLTHANSNVEQGYFVHLYRLTAPGAKRSGRDWSNRSAQICPKECVSDMLAHTSITGYYGMYDAERKYLNGLWLIAGGGMTRLA